MLSGRPTPKRLTAWLYHFEILLGGTPPTEVEELALDEIVSALNQAKSEGAIAGKTFLWSFWSLGSFNSINCQSPTGNCNWCIKKSPVSSNKHNHPCLQKRRPLLTSYNYREVIALLMYWEKGLQPHATKPLLQNLPHSFLGSKLVKIPLQI